MTYLSDRDDIETAEADEQESIDGIIKGMTQESMTAMRCAPAMPRARPARPTT